jgi:hypothetical protein
MFSKHVGDIAVKHFFILFEEPKSLSILVGTSRHYCNILIFK